MKKYSFILLFIFVSCKEEDKVDPYVWKEIKVKVTAYNSVKSQTDSSPSIAAWGDTLKPNMKCIAVSRDLLRLGLKHNSPVKIEGFDSIYVVKDKMHSRKRKQIDIYMGLDVKKARKWGVQRLTIKYGVLKTDLQEKLYK